MGSSKDDAQHEFIEENQDCTEFVAMQISFDKIKFLLWLEKYRNWTISSNLIEKAKEEL